MEKEIAPERTRDMAKAGWLYFLAGSIVFLGIIIGEMFYPPVPGYTTRHSQISDLGATVPPDSIITQPSAAIFNTSMLVAGALLILGAYFIHKAFRKRGASALCLLFGLGALGVGIFPGNMAPWHAVFALTTFIAGALSAIISARLMTSPLRYAYVLFGIVSLVFLFGNQSFAPIFGLGGTERIVAYPIVLWVISFGGYLAGRGGKEA